jgi:prophage maintenance system killer protein
MADSTTLTVQDLLWINLRVTGTEPQWDFMKLEEGTFYQFSYGSSDSVVARAARFLAGLSKIAPFANGNRATAFVACLAFLAVNGLAADLPPEDASKWVGRAQGDAALAAIEGLVSQSDHGEYAHPSVEEAVEHILGRFGPILSELEQTGTSQKL